VPLVELNYAITNSESIQDLVSYDSPTLRIIDASGLGLSTIGETVDGFPIAPGLRNTMMLGITCTEATLGVPFPDILPQMTLALISYDVDSSG
jgi:hypothetical protein